MNLKLLWLVIMIVLLLSVPAVSGTGNRAVSNVNYFDFLNLFFPGSPDFTYHIFYKPGGTVHAYAGEQANVTFYIEKINMTKHAEFYIKFVVTRSFWEPYRTPSSESSGFLEKLKKYNVWLNSTQSLTSNLYKITPERVCFKENMTNLTINLKFTIYGWGNDWGITILARPVNGSLWIPVSGIPVNVTGRGTINNVFSYLYTGGSIIIFVATTVILKKRRNLVALNKNKNRIP